jgi:DinB superfamily
MPEDRAKLIRYLQDSQQEFLACISGVTDVQWNWKPMPDRWSIGENAQHLLLAEGLLFKMAQKALTSEPNPDWETKTRGKTELLERAMVDRSRKARAPEPVNPVGIMMARDQVVATFQEVRAKTIEFSQSTPLPLQEHLGAGPFPRFDPLNAYQFLLYIPLHNLRHNQQIAEVQATPGYPK